MSWLSRIFSRGTPAQPMAVDDGPPSWLPELTDPLQRLGRAQAKCSARIEAVESKLEAGLADLRACISRIDAPRASEADLTPLLDSLDLLDTAMSSLTASGDRGEQTRIGLTGVADRIM